MSHETHTYDAKANLADLPGASNHSSGVQGTLPQAANISKILTTEEFAEEMKMCVETVNLWKQTGKLRNGVHYLQIGSKVTFPWPHAFIMLMKDMQELSGAESNEKQTNIVANTVSRRINIVPPKASKTARQKERQPKINLGYKPQ